jgi:hypothetical protein
MQGVLFYPNLAPSLQPEEGWVMSPMDLHFTIRLFIVGIALIYVLSPMFWHWREG